MINANKVEINSEQALRALQAIRSIGVTPLDMKICYRLSRIGDFLESHVRNFTKAQMEGNALFNAEITSIQTEINKYANSDDPEMVALHKDALARKEQATLKHNKQVEEAAMEPVSFELPIVSISDLTLQEDRILYRTINKEGGIQETVKEEYKKGQPAVSSQIMILLAPVIAE